jgi:hypothetical protein
MPVSAGVDQIQASQYNTLRTTVSSILNTNYGQSLNSIAVVSDNVSSPVASTDLRNLFLDIQKTQVHHTGSLNANIEIPPTGVTIAADTSQNYNQSTGALTALTNGTRMGFNDFELAVNTLSNFNPSTANIWPVGNFTLGTAISSSRSTTWGGASQDQSIYHIVTFTFASSTARNQFFSAGGELRFSASLAGGSGTKSVDWTNLLSAIGTIRFSKWRLTASSGTPNPTGSGFDSLSGIYRLLYTKSGSGVYAENQYTIEARIESTTILRFRIRFEDADVGDPPLAFPLEGIDESVNGTVTSTVNTFRPDSSFVFNSTPVTAVSLPAPAMTTVVALTTNNATPPA